MEMRKEEGLTKEQEVGIVLEAIKYYVAFGAPKELEKEILQGIAQELDRLQISGKAVLLAIAEVKARDEVEEIFDELQNVVPFRKRALPPKIVGQMGVHTLKFKCCNNCEHEDNCHCQPEDCVRAKQNGRRVAASIVAANIRREQQLVSQ
ncbi:MAG TPA: hypothetical protein PK085_01745 [bacterium]|nr:hypothetical protein [bacterium]